MTDAEFATAGSAQVSVLHEGYVREDSRGYGALAAAGPGPDDVTDVVFSHHHPDHTSNAALFPRATIHDHWASYQGDLWISRDPGDFELTPSVRLIATPGHTAEDITTLAATPEGVYACTHAWWGPDGPAQDPLATDQAALDVSRRRILAVATVIVPGHGPAFRPAAG